ncbi:hypothetical protein DM50_1927 [Burkholderia mallei]|nr:hypothetical protein DM50_1927 [Burkholderia mallei]KOT07320.1 hypothetical protein DM77_1932 [Burkholderia mallei]
MFRCTRCRDAIIKGRFELLSSVAYSSTRYGCPFNRCLKRDGKAW